MGRMRIWNDATYAQTHQSKFNLIVYQNMRIELWAILLISAGLLASLGHCNEWKGSVHDFWLFKTQFISTSSSSFLLFFLRARVRHCQFSVDFHLTIAVNWERLFRGTEDFLLDTEFRLYQVHLASFLASWVSSESFLFRFVILRKSRLSPLV